MEVAQLRPTSHDDAWTDRPPMADSFGGFGWLALFTIVALAYLLAEHF